MEIIPISAIIVRNHIRDYRKHQELTQEELAKHLGVSRQSIISVETGRCLPSVPLALALSRFFNSPLESIFEIETNHSSGTSDVPQEDIMNRVIGPFRGISNIHESIDRMFEDALVPMRRTNEIMPSMNISQTDKEIIVEADVPGMKEDEVDIEISDNVLTIKGERTVAEEQQNREYFHREVSYGAFQRAVTLPVDVDAAKAVATVKHGQLKVVLPKVEPEQPKVHKLKAKSE